MIVNRLPEAASDNAPNADAVVRDEA